MTDEPAKRLMESNPGGNLSCLLEAFCEVEATPADVSRLSARLAGLTGTTAPRGPEGNSGGGSGAGGGTASTGSFVMYWAIGSVSLLGIIAYIGFASGPDTNAKSDTNTRQVSVSTELSAIASTQITADATNQPKDIYSPQIPSPSVQRLSPQLPSPSVQRLSPQLPSAPEQTTNTPLHPEAPNVAYAKDKLSRTKTVSLKASGPKKQHIEAKLSPNVPNFNAQTDRPRNPLEPTPASEKIGDGMCLECELKLLRSARSAMTAGKYSVALKWTEQHRDEHSEGELSEEREAIAIRSLIGLDKKEKARKRFEALQRQNPNSMYNAGIEELL